MTQVMFQLYSGFILIIHKTYYYLIGVNILQRLQTKTLFFFSF